MNGEIGKIKRHAPSEKILESALVDQAGRKEKPKVVVVPIASVGTGYLYAAYSMTQGKRGGRRTDFTGCLRLDGLVVDEAVVPDSGVIAIMPDVVDADVAAVGRKWRDFHIWGAENVHQLLLTNGRVWVAFVRDHNGELAVREVFARPDAKVEHRIDNYELPDPGDNAIFMERLRRALIPWKKLDEPQVLGAFMASYGRSYSLAFAADDAQDDLRSRYVTALKSDLGITFDKTDGDIAVSRHLIAVLLLGMIGDRLSIPDGIDFDVEIPVDLRLGFGCLPRPENGVVMDPVSVAADVFRKNPHPGHALNFCEAFWTGLAEDNRACESWNRLPYSVFESHVALLEKRMVDNLPLLAGLDNPKICWLDLRAGTGGMLIAALARIMPADKRLAGTVFAVEADPLKFQVLRLRTMTTILEMFRKRRPVPSINLSLANPLIKRGIIPRIDVGQFLLVTGDLCFPGERGLDIKGAPELAEQYQKAARDEWGIHTFDAGQPFVQYAGLVENILRGQKQAAALLLTPKNWVENDAYAGVRQAFMNEANEMLIGSMPEPFAWNTQIRKSGIASAILVKLVSGGRVKAFGCEIQYADDLESIVKTPENWRELRPTRDNRHSLAPVRSSNDYAAWPSLRELVATDPIAGPMEQRGFALIQHERDSLAAQMRDYFNPEMDDATLAKHYPSLMTDTPRFDAAKTRRRLLEKLSYSEERITPFLFKPFDVRWAYLDSLRPLFKEPADDLQKLAVIPGNTFLVIGEPNDRAPAGLAAWCSSVVCDYNFFSGSSRHFPLYIEKTPPGRGRRKTVITPNLSGKAMFYLDAIASKVESHGKNAGIANEREVAARQGELSKTLWHHILAVLFTPSYQHENGGAIQRDWPRIPIPYWNNPHKFHHVGGSLEFFSSQGKRIAELLAMSPLKRDEWPALDTIAVLAKSDDTSIQQNDFPLSPSWSVKSKINAVRPGKGETTTRPYSIKEEDELALALRNFRVDWRSVREAFGSRTVDVRLCDGIWWKNIPESVWNFEIGGFKVLRKWLSYRGVNVFGRNLSVEDCTVFSDMARRLAILVLMGLALNYSWPRLVAEAGK